MINVFFLLVLLILVRDFGAPRLREALQILFLLGELPSREEQLVLRSKINRHVKVHKFF